MDGIVISVDPVLARFGPLTVRWYGVFFALAVAAGIWLGVREARRTGIADERVQTLAMWAVAGGLIGARLFHVLDRWDLYVAEPIRILNVTEGGLAIYGGLAGGLVAGLAYALRAGLPVWKLLDAAAPGMILGQAVGRLACIPNGDAYGAPAHLPWAFIYTNPGAVMPRELLGVPTHPYAVYELLFDLALLGLLWRVRGVYRRDGLLFLTYAVVYAAGRFLLTFYRVEQIWFWQLQEAQLVALVALVVGLPLLARRLWQASGRSHWPLRGQPA